MEQNTALLVMDMQAKMLSMLPDSDAVIANVAQAIEKARANGIPVIYVVVGFRAGAPEMSPHNKSSVNIKARMEIISPEEWTKIHPALAPQNEEIIVTKRRYSAFTGSDLEVVLRAKGIQHIVLTGYSTSGVVLSTLREAADKDYRITVLTDCCGDADPEVQRVLTTKIFPRQADVLLVAEW